jgi:hypothetical protein
MLIQRKSHDLNKNILRKAAQISGLHPDLIPFNDRKIKKSIFETSTENKEAASLEIKLAESRINCDFLPQSRPVRQCLFQIQTARLSLS